MSPIWHKFCCYNRNADNRLAGRIPYFQSICNNTVNRFLFLFLLTGALANPGFAQNFERCAEVISSSGKYATRNNRSYFYTVGEPVVLTLKSTQHQLTQGFHQPDLCVTVATHNIDLEAWGIEVFPNPTSDFLTIRFDKSRGNALRIAVFNLLAQTVVANQPLESGSLTLDCSSWQPGVYLLRIRDAQTNASSTLRFIKV